VLSETRKSYTDKLGDGDFVLGVDAINVSGKVKESLVIFEDFKKRRKWLYERNRTDVRYSSHVVTSGD